MSNSKTAKPFFSLSTKYITDEKHDFVTDITGGLHLGTVNSATMEINYEDMCILQFGQSQ